MSEARKPSSTPRAARTAIVFIFLLLYLTWSPETIRVVGQLHNEWVELITVENPRLLLREISTPRAGEFVLPPLARDGIALLRSHEVSEFSISPSASQDVEIRHRLIEGAYPIRYAVKASYVLQLVNEPVMASCSRIAVQGGMALAHCP